MLLGLGKTIGLVPAPRCRFLENRTADIKGLEEQSFKGLREFHDHIINIRLKKKKENQVENHERWLV